MEQFETRFKQVDVLPMVKHFIDRLDLFNLFSKYVPPATGSFADHAEGLCVLTANIICDNKPLYKVGNTTDDVTHIPNWNGLRTLLEKENFLWPHNSVGFYPIGYGRGKLSDSDWQIRHFSQLFQRTGTFPGTPGHPLIALFLPTASGAKCLDRRPAAHRTDQPAAHQIGPPALADALVNKLPVRLSGLCCGFAEPFKHLGHVLPPEAFLAHDGRMTAPAVSITSPYHLSFDLLP